MKTQLLIALLVISGIAKAQAPAYLWAKSAGGTNDDYGQSISTDSNGSVFVTGRFSSSSIVFGTTILTNTGGNDIFIVKYDSSGNVLWANSAGGTNDDYGQSISTDANGNVYVTGYFRSLSIVFGTTTLTNPFGGTSPDIFIVKYDGSGNVLWAKSAEGSSSDEGQSISTDANGNVYLTGYFRSLSIVFETTTLTNASTSTVPDIFIVKYDSSGNVLWANSAGGTGYDKGQSISTDASGNVYLTGHFQSSSIVFGSDTLTNGNGGFYDVFIVKYDSSGNVLWAKSAGGTGTADDDGYSISTDANGNVFVTGCFFSSSIVFGTTTLTNASTGTVPDIFIVKYDSSGNVLWAKSAGGTSYDEGHSISTDANGNVFVAGYYFSSSIVFGTTTLTNAGGYDIFIVKYDASGNELWAKSEGGTHWDYGQSISTDANGNVFATGHFQSSSIVFGATTLINAGAGNDIFIVKLDAITGIESLENENNFAIYPNPFFSQTVLHSDFLLKNATLTVDNCLGQTVKEIKNISGQSVVLFRDNLVSGQYFFWLTEKNKTIAVGKLIITDK